MQYRAEAFRASILSLLVLLCLPLGAQTGKSTADTDARIAGPSPRGAVNGGDASAGAAEGYASSIVAGIQTNARDGGFSEAQTFWFSLAGAALSAGDELRLYLDSEEVYRGAGPASVNLDAAAGSERFFDIRVERRGRFGTGPVEGHGRWSVLIDRVPPQTPRLGVESLAGGAKRLRVDQQSGSRIMGLLDAPGYPCEPMVLPEELRIESGRFQIIAWAVDGAGNESLPAQHREGAARLELVSPVSGLWANRQLLYLESEGTTEILYTTDGSDPLLGGGLPYRGPVRIDRTGTVFLRVAARTEDGSTLRRELRYTVRESGDDLLKALGEAESGPGGMHAISLPAGFFASWAASLPLLDIVLPSDPRHAAFGPEQTISLPPPSSLFRREPLVVCRGSTLWRFVLPLGGHVHDAAERPDSNAGRMDLGEGLSLFSTPRLRAIVREGGEAGFYWRFTPTGRSVPGDWQRARRVLPLSREEGLLEWFPVGGNPELPQSFKLVSISESTALPLAVAQRPSEGRDPLLVSLQDGAEPLALTLRLASRGPGDTRDQCYPFVLEAGRPLSIEAAGGEELVVSLEDSAGREIGSWVIDRRAPPPPVVKAPVDGSLSDNALSFEIVSEWPLDGSLRVEIEDLSGGVFVEDRIPAPGLHRVAPDDRGPLLVRLDLAARDAAGNVSSRVVRSFGVDSGTIYLDTAAAAGAAASSSAAAGSRARPCRSLDEALVLAAQRGLQRIAVRGNIVLEHPLELTAGGAPSGIALPGQALSSEQAADRLQSAVPQERPILIEGGFLGGWVKGPQPSKLTLAEGTSFGFSGRSVFLRDIHLMRPGSSPEPLVLLGAGAQLSLLRARLDADGLLVRAEGAHFAARFSLFSSRFGAFDMHLSTLSLEDSLVSVRTDTDAPAAISLDGGLLRAERVQMSVASSRFATALAITGSEAALTGCGLRIDAGEFVTALDVQGGQLSVLEGEIAARARDVVLVSIQEADAQFRGVRLCSSADGVSRAFLVRGTFPRVTESRIEHGGTSTHSELFAGEEPVAGSVHGNLFVSWQFLYRRLLADDDLAVFNRRYGIPGEQNRVERVY